MELNLTPEQEARLAEIAQHQGVTVDAFVTDIALGLIDKDNHKREMIRRGLRQAG